MSPGPGSGVMSSMRRTVGRVAGQLQLDRLVVREAGRRVHRVLLDRDPLAVVRVLDDLQVVGRQADRPEQGLEHDPADP